MKLNGLDQIKAFADERINVAEWFLSMIYIYIYKIENIVRKVSMLVFSSLYL